MVLLIGLLLCGIQWKSPGLKKVGGVDGFQGSGVHHGTYYQPGSASQGVGLLLLVWSVPVWTEDDGWKAPAINLSGVGTSRGSKTIVIWLQDHFTKQDNKQKLSRWSPKDGRQHFVWGHPWGRRQGYPCPPTKERWLSGRTPTTCPMITTTMGGLPLKTPLPWLKGQMRETRLLKMIRFASNTILQYL